MIIHISDDPPYSFGFESFRGDAVTPVPEPACTRADGHLFERQPVVLLSYPRQHVWSCIREGCSVVRHVSERVPEPERQRDPR